MVIWCRGANERIWWTSEAAGWEPAEILRDWGNPGKECWSYETSRSRSMSCVFVICLLTYQCVIFVLVHSLIVSFYNSAFQTFMQIMLLTLLVILFHYGYRYIWDFNWLVLTGSFCIKTVFVSKQALTGWLRGVVVSVLDLRLTRSRGSTPASSTLGSSSGHAVYTYLPSEAWCFDRLAAAINIA